MNQESGMTLPELLIVVAVAALAIGATAAISIPMIAKETARSAVYHVQSYVQLARVEAVSRNRDCRFELDTESKRIRVVDTKNTTVRSDDEVLYTGTLSNTMSFASPDGSTPVTLDNPGGGRYEILFASSGTVDSGAGEVGIYGGTVYTKLTVFGAGGTQVQRWEGSGWVAGS